MPEFFDARDTQDPAQREAALMAGIFSLSAFLWATEALPLFVTALLVLALEMVVAAAVAGAIYLLYSRLMRIPELTRVLGLIRSALPHRRAE